MIQASNGNFYGTELGGSAECTNVSVNLTGYCGAIFQVTPSGVGSTVYDFHGADGFNPVTLIEGADGNLYGITQVGGPSYSATSNGSGTVFQLTPAGKLTILHSFATSDGAAPSSLIQGQDGNLYGTTAYGGSGNCSTPASPSGCGTVFKITTTGQLSTVYTFTGAAGDGLFDPLSLFQLSNGTIYGAAVQSNNETTTVVFSVTPTGVLTQLATITPPSGGNFDLIAPGIDGNIYGITEGEMEQTSDCGTQPVSGTVFKITPAGQLTDLYTFCSQTGCAAPASFYGAFLQAGNGNLYFSGTFGNCQGGLLELASTSPPAISSTNGVVNGASFQPGISPGSWFAIYGTNFLAQTASWTIVNDALPITLGGISVSVGGQPAYVEYVSPTQINALAPSVPAGSVPVIVTNSIGTSQTVNAQLSAEAPAFFQWGDYAVATHQDYSYAVKNGTFTGLTTVPAAPGDVIILWGTGFGPTSPAVPAGIETPSATIYNTATLVSVKVGSQNVTVYGAALAPGFAGLYQVAIQIPAGLANGDYPVVAAINGVSSPATTLITIQQ
jgi:uncharacterized protein (TIGR03437 family)